MAEHGRLDVVFSNAGVLLAGNVETMDEAIFDRTLAVNLKGAFLVAKYTIPAAAGDPREPGLYRVDIVASRGPWPGRLLRFEGRHRGLWPGCSPTNSPTMASG